MGAGGQGVQGEQPPSDFTRPPPQGGISAPRSDDRKPPTEGAPGPRSSTGPPAPSSDSTSPPPRHALKFMAPAAPSLRRRTADRAVARYTPRAPSPARSADGSSAYKTSSHPY